MQPRQRQPRSVAARGRTAARALALGAALALAAGCGGGAGEGAWGADARGAAGTGGLGADAAAGTSGGGEDDGAAPSAMGDGASPDVGGTDAGAADAGAPHPTSTRCGDGIRDPLTEECDEGATTGPNEPCTAACRVRDVSLLAPSGPPDAGAAIRSLGTSAHVAAGSDSGLAIVYVEPSTTPSVGVQLFDAAGARRGAPVDVTAGFVPPPAPNPAVAALPDGAFAVAWTDVTDGAPAVRLRRVTADGAGAARLAHDSVAGLHSDPDLLWVGDRLLVAYTSLLDVKARAFDANLVPLGSEQTIAASATAIESNVTLAPFGAGWAAAVRSNTDGLESIVVRSGDLSWSTPPGPPGPAGDRPALAALDDTHLVVVFSVGTDGAGTRTTDVARLRAAVLSTAAPGPVTVAAFGPALAADDETSVSRPVLARAGDAVVAGWTEKSAGGLGGERVVLGRLASTTAWTLEAGPPPLAAGSSWDSNLHVAVAPVFPGATVISVWERAASASALAPVDLVIDLRPAPFVYLDSSGGT